MLNVSLLILFRFQKQSRIHELQAKQLLIKTTQRYLVMKQMMSLLYIGMDRRYAMIYHTSHRSHLGYFLL